MEVVITAWLCISLACCEHAHQATEMGNIFLIILYSEASSPSASRIHATENDFFLKYTTKQTCLTSSQFYL